MSHPEQIILKDSRSRIVLCTIAKDDHDDRFHFACCFCDGDFLSFNSCEAHIRLSHLTNPINEPQPIIKTETPMDVDEIVEISDDELETISISSDEPEEVQPNGTSANAQNQVIVTSETMQNGINGSANVTNGKVINPSQTNETQPMVSTSKGTPNKPAEKNATETVPQADSTGHEKMSYETVTNGKQPSAGNQTTQRKQSQQQEQPKPSTSKPGNATSEEETDDDISFISSIESENSTASNGQRQTSENEPKGNQSDMTKNYPCKYCPKTFATFDEYRAHEYSCEDWRKSMFPCPVKGCPKRYAYRNSRDHHIDKKHKNFGFACGICVRRFTSEKLKCEHQMSQHTTNEIKPCLFCEKECLSIYERNIHVQEYHSECECPVCKQSYKSKMAMLAHKEEVHSKK